VGIRHPQGEGILGAVTLHSGESVHTSGNYERYNEFEGVRYAHIIDPRTGMPVKEIASATVIHTNGATADAGATALVVAGREDWLRIARRMGITLAMLVDEQGNVYITPGMLQRVELERPPPPERLKVSEPL
jgi:thiamine biosynthesis lipoprotein